MKRENGFTFLEMMIAFSIFSILILVVYATFFSEITKYDNRSVLINMNMDANRAMDGICEDIDNHGDINVANARTVTSSGVVIIDTLDDGVNNGSFLNLDGRRLVDVNGTILADNVEAITFIMGPDASTGIGVMDDVILIQVLLEKNEVQYFLKGGVNIAR